jgi:ATPase subunit of ABC transporter with duplicated ATPase domains
MIQVNNVTVSFGNRVLFEDVNLKFTPGNCYGIIGANGAGKSTFLKVLSGEIEASRGEVSIDRKARMAVLKQDHFAYEDEKVQDIVCMGFPRLWKLMKEREALYAKANFTDEDGLRSGELENEFAEIGGYEAEQEVGRLLSGLGIPDELHYATMRELDGGLKVRALLAQALFGKPDILLLDEPTNHLDYQSMAWLEEYLINFPNTVIVVSHDRHFLNQVCTHTADIDYKKITVYPGSYSFWKQASELVELQRRDSSKKREDKMKDLKAFIQRFSSNASKARQATSRKKILDSLSLEDLPISNRKYPHILFTPFRPCGKTILTVNKLSAEIDGRKVFSDLTFNVMPNAKIAFVGQDDVARTALFQILAGEKQAADGVFEWGTTIKVAYFPKDHERFFDTDLNLIDWLRQYSPEDQSEEFVRGYLGRMLFSGQEATKPARVLSGGEKVRCMLSRAMLMGANVLILDEPTNHLDLESITALNEALSRFPEVVLFSSHDREFIETVATHIFEITPLGNIQREMPFSDYLEDAQVQKEQAKLYVD